MTGHIGFVAPGASASAAALYVTGVLFFANLIGYLDRKILALLVEPVKNSLGLSDGEIGLMQGAAFVITFSVAGLLVGKLVDRRNRRNLLIVCVAIWSICTAACGFAQSGTQLFIARMGVGVGEAALIPAAVSLFADYFPPDRRGKPYGFFSMGVYAGSGLSMILVGLLLAPVTALSADLAGRGIVLEPWRIIMMAMILPGIVCCALLATMREPERDAASGTDRLPTRSGYGDWLDLKRILLPHHLSMALVTLGLLGMSTWIPTVLIREHALSAREAGLLYGTVYAVGGVCSSFLGGVLSDRANRRGGRRGGLVLAMGCVIVAAAGFLVLMNAQTPMHVMIGTVMVFAPSSIALVTGIMVTSDLAPSRSRGQIMSIHFLFTGIIGLAGGPAVVGYVNDLSLGAALPLSGVIALTGVTSASLALLLIWLTMTRLRTSSVPD